MSVCVVCDESTDVPSPVAWICFLRRCCCRRYDKTKRLVVPEALRVVKLSSARRYSTLGVLASQLGWKHAELIGRLEAVRKESAAAFHEKRKGARKAAATAAQSAEVQAINAELAAYGY